MNNTEPIIEKLTPADDKFINEIEQHLKVDLATYQCQSDEELKDGVIYCKKCGEPRTAKSHNGQFDILTGCPCELAQYKQQQEQADYELEMKRFKEQKLEKQRVVANELRTKFLGARYTDSRFDNFDTQTVTESIKRAYEICQRYTEKFTKDTTMGLYLFGTKGTGKTTLSACIMNDLLDKGFIVIYTNMINIKNEWQRYFGREVEYEKIKDIYKTCDLLILDDIGTELITADKNSKAQELAYEIINARYNSNKPMIFNSNYNITELISKGNYADKTVDRIGGMSVVVELKGNSYRLNNKI